MLNTIMDMLSIREPLALDVAESFTVLLQDDELVLTRASFANVSVRVFFCLLYDDDSYLSNCIRSYTSNAFSTIAYQCLFLEQNLRRMKVGMNHN